ncbi:hypothetical protein GCM10025872_03450 [Barrientosiimonas endolithica]|uniref:Uncharacterized protein n=1 Tax=Barrientosiimonas endolithica TaxID=1535208 RepID=A0ABN6YM52_9MICO|nr:hypothetical protein GCM10025872_03450 [Barrientosiimonas endolithica]
MVPGGPEGGPPGTLRRPEAGGSVSGSEGQGVVVPSVGGWPERPQKHCDADQALVVRQSPCTWLLCPG